MGRGSLSATQDSRGAARAPAEATARRAGRPPRPPTPAVPSTLTPTPPGRLQRGLRPHRWRTRETTPGGPALWPTRMRRRCVRRRAAWRTVASRPPPPLVFKDVCRQTTPPTIGGGCRGNVSCHPSQSDHPSRSDYPSRSRSPSIFGQARRPTATRTLCQYQRH